MKFFVTLILFFVFGSSVQAQRKLLLHPYQVHTYQATIGEFLQDINRSTGIVLEYSSAHFDAHKTVKLTGSESTVGDVLRVVLHGQLVQIREHNQKIILIPSASPFTIEPFLPARYSFYGYIKENATREPLASATIYEPLTKRGVVSNNYGYFNFLLPPGKHSIIISYGGLQEERLDLDVQDNIRKDILMLAEQDTLPTIVVQSTALAREGAVKIADEQLESEGFWNEDDPLQYLYLSPGLQNASYSFSGFHVRGGGTDENQFLLDGNPVYNPTHLLGAISIVNPTVVKTMRFYKSDFPARLGGSLSSVLDVFSKQGNMKNWQGEINAGMLAGSVTLEGPLVKDRVALMLSGRKHLPLRFFHSFQNGVTSDFYDVHFRLSAVVTPRNTMSVHFYKGEDQLKHQGKYTQNLSRWGNTVGSAGWNYVLGNRSFINTTVNYSEYQNLGSYQYTLFEKDTDADTADDDTDVGEEDDEPDTGGADDLSMESKFIGTYSSIKTYDLKSQAEMYISRKLKLNAGIKLSQTEIKPFDSNVTSTMEDDENNFLNFTPLQFEELSGYGEAEIKLTRRLFVKPGLHIAGYRLSEYDTLTFQPRLFVSYRLHPAHKLFASYSRMHQFLHLVTNPYAGANRDLWVPSTTNLHPESSDIFNIGYAFQMNRQWKFSLDAYYKLLQHVTNYAEGKSTFINSSNWEQNIESGKGKSYGTELLFKKTGRKLLLQAGYALSWSWRQFSSINNGKPFPYKYDHRHAVNIGLTYAITPRIEVTGLWSFATGNVYTGSGVVFKDTLITVPEDDPLLDYNFIFHYSPADQYRAKSYQRYDVSFVYHTIRGRKWYTSLKAGLYNINGAAGQYSYNLRGSMSSKSIRIKTGNSAFDVIPYLSLTIRF